MSIIDVIYRPSTSSANDTIKPTNGPDKPKSNIDFKLGGGDCSGVMVPMHPNCRDGINVGAPILNYVMNAKFKGGR
jgi:hypothetical protein